MDSAGNMNGIISDIIGKNEYPDVMVDIHNKVTSKPNNIPRMAQYPIGHIKAVTVSGVICFAKRKRVRYMRCGHFCNGLVTKDAGSGVGINMGPF